jgi:hypothetical protein
MSEKCHEQTWRVPLLKRKAPVKADSITLSDEVIYSETK